MAQCSEYSHIDGILYRCSVTADVLSHYHDGKHRFDKVADIMIRFDRLDEKQTAEIHAETPDNEFFTQDDIRRALWLALDEHIDDLLRDLNDLVGERAFEKYLDLVWKRKMEELEQVTA